MLPTSLWPRKIDFPLQIRCAQLGVAFDIDVQSQFTSRWRVSRNIQTDFVLDALQQALYIRQPDLNSLTHRSGPRVQFPSIRYPERLAEAGIEPSVGSEHDSRVSALVETINFLYKAAVIHFRGAWETTGTVDIATLEWVLWFNPLRC
jgi:putative transposase